MLVRQFAFDLELLAIVHEKGFRVAESPITLRAEGTWHMPGLSTVKQVIMDTLATFYRLRLLRYYQTIRDTRMPEPPPRVSIIIAFPAPSACLDECLAGIQGQSYTRYEVLLLPDAPTGRAWPEPVREIPTGTRRPADKGIMGIREARGEIVSFMKNYQNYKTAVGMAAEYVEMPPMSEDRYRPRIFEGRFWTFGELVMRWDSRGEMTGEDLIPSLPAASCGVKLDRHGNIYVGIGANMVMADGKNHSGGCVAKFGPEGAHEPAVFPPDLRRTHARPQSKRYYFR
jgi:hypothetical protein